MGPGRMCRECRLHVKVIVAKVTPVEELVISVHSNIPVGSNN